MKSMTGMLIVFSCLLYCNNLSADVTLPTVRDYADGGPSTVNNVATGSTLNLSDVASAVATAFDNDLGGVWNFDAPYDQLDQGDNISLTYGLSNALEVTFELGGGSINQDTSSGASEAISGSGVLGLTGGTATRTFTSDTPLTLVAITNTDRGDASRIPFLSVTLQNGDTLSTSGANADDTFLHVLTASNSNPIVSFSLNQNSFVRYDDLAFITIPEPSIGVMSFMALGLVLRRNKKS